jgi:hypothetical protein
MELFFECEGWPPCLLYGFLWQPTSDPARTPLSSTNFLPLPLQLKSASSKYCSGKYVPRNTPSEYRIRHPRD